MSHYHTNFRDASTSGSGYWGPPTSLANFCEEDYALTFYIGEFINSVSNLAYVYYALRHRPKNVGGASRQPLDSMSVSLLLVGITSGVYHATLQPRPQMGDELSMILLAGSFVQRSAGLGLAAEGATRALVKTASWAVVAAVAAVYVATGSMKVHKLAFTGLLAASVPGVLHSVFWTRRSPGDRRSLTRRLLKAAGLGVLAFALWNVDFEFCAELRRLRAAVGLPWAWLFELHGWWHLLTAAAAGGYIDVLRELGGRPPATARTLSTLREK